MNRRAQAAPPPRVAPRAPGSRSRQGPHVGPLRITPIRVVIALALIGSLAYLAFALTVRDTTQIPMLASGAAVLGVVFVALAISGALAAYRYGLDGAGGKAFGVAVVGGIAAMIAAGCFAAAVVLALVWQA